MSSITIRLLQQEDKDVFLTAMQSSQLLHQPWVNAPLTEEEFELYIQKSNQANQQSFVVCCDDYLAGIINVSEIVRGVFQNAFLGFYAVADFAGKGYMSKGLRLVLEKVFHEMGLHRVEANIQPDNERSIALVKKVGFRYEGFSPRYLKINDVWCGHEHWAMTLEDFIREEPDVVDKDSVQLVDYQREWPYEAKNEIDRLVAVLPPHKIIDIQHVGSTAIPGLSAKPIIDIQIAAKSLDEMKVIAVPALQKLGYEYWAENPDPGRMFFVKGMPPFGERRTHHVHIFEPTSHHWRDKIAFRDYLIAHPDVAHDYQNLKFKLAADHALDREEYTNAKAEFVAKVLKLAGEGV